MPTLLVSGDSWTACWPLEQELGHRNFGWPTLVSKQMSYTLIDKSRSGSSNYRIYRKAFDGMLQHKIDLALVFLTSWTRMETGAGYGPKPGHIYQHMPMDSGEQSRYVFEYFFNGYKNYTDLLRMIISLQNLSNTVGTDCYFLDTYENNLLFEFTLDDFKKILAYNQNIFDNLNDTQINDKFNKVKFLTSRIDRTKFISAYSYEHIIKGCTLHKGHPVEDGHRKIANTVLDFLKENNHG